MLSLEQETDVVKAKPAERRDHLKKIYNLDFKQTLADIDTEIKEHSLEVAKLTASVEGLEHKTYLEPTKPEKPFSENEKAEYETKLKTSQEKLAKTKQLAEDAKANQEQYQKLLAEQTSVISKKTSEQQALEQQKMRLSSLPDEEQKEKSALELQLKDCIQDKERIEGELSTKIKELESELSIKKSSLKRVGIFDQESYTDLKA